MASRAEVSSWTRMGTWRSPAENRASAGPTSPIVAIRMTSAICAVVTPSSEARSAFGTIFSSGRSRPADEFGRMSSSSERICCVIRCAMRLTSSPSGPVNTIWKRRWPFSSKNQYRMSGTGRMRFATSRFISSMPRARSPFATSETISVALRTSLPDPSTCPPLTNTRLTSSRSSNRREMSRVTARVSSSVEPGGSSTAIIIRPVSSAGRKPEGRSCIEAIEPAKTKRPRMTVAIRRRTDQATSEV